MLKYSILFPLTPNNGGQVGYEKTVKRIVSYNTTNDATTLYHSLQNEFILQFDLQLNSTNPKQKKEFSPLINTN